MALTDLLAALDDEAAEELARAEDTAAAEAERVRAAAAADAEQILNRALVDAQRDGAAAAARELAAARTDAAGVVRAAQQRALEAVFDQAGRRLAALRSDPHYPAVLRGCLVEALQALPAAVTIRVDEHDQDQARDILDDILDELLGDLPDDLLGDRASAIEVRADLRTWGGVVVADGGGRFVDNRLETRLEAVRPRMRAQLARGWQGEPTSGKGD